MRNLKTPIPGDYLPGTIFHGLAIVPRVVDSRRDGWAMPGGGIVSSYDMAKRVAVMMDQIMRGRA
jgi:hypothetical protein